MSDPYEIYVDAVTGREPQDTSEEAHQEREQMKDEQEDIVAGGFAGWIPSDNTGSIDPPKQRPPRGF